MDSMASKCTDPGCKLFKFYSHKINSIIIHIQFSIPPNVAVLFLEFKVNKLYYVNDRTQIFNDAHNISLLLVNNIRLIELRVRVKNIKIINKSHFI